MLSLAHIRRRAARRAGLFRRLSDLVAINRSRARLAVLDDHMLRDIGLSRDEALREADRPFWDAPSHWKR